MNDETIGDEGIRELESVLRTTSPWRSKISQLTLIPKLLHSIQVLLILKLTLALLTVINCFHFCCYNYTYDCVGLLYNYCVI